MGKSTNKRHLTKEYKDYMRKYYQEHRDELLAKSKLYYREHREEMNEYGKSWRVANSEKVSKLNKKYYILHKDEILAKQRVNRLEKLNNN